MLHDPSVYAGARRPRFLVEDYFLLRAPAFSVAVYEEWIRSAAGTLVAEERRGCLRRYLVEKFATSPALLSALEFASPSAAAALRSERETKNRSVKQSRRLEQTLVKYFSRAHARSTPFGLFAGAALGGFGETTAMEIAAPDEHSRLVRVDYSLLASVIDWLTKRVDVRRASRYRVNSSLYTCAGRARFVERKGTTHRDVNYELAAVELSPGVALVISEAESLRSWGQLRDLLFAESDDVEEVEQFLDDLIDSQVLVSELECSVTTDDPLETLARQLCSMNVAPDIVKELDRLSRIIGNLARPGSPLTSEAVAPIARVFESMGAPYFRDNTLYVQVQLTPKRPLVVNEMVRNEIERAIECLVALTPGLPMAPFAAAQDELEGFRVAFQRRYDDAMVPVGVALDPENGIGFFGSWSASAVDRRTPGGVATAMHGESEQYLSELLSRLSPTGDREMVLTPEDIGRLSRKSIADPGNFMQVLTQLEAASERAIDEGNFLILVDRCIGPTETSLSARFGVGNAGLTERLRRTASMVEGEDERVLAEIVHLVGHRASNVVTRPRLSTYEIPYLARSEAPEHQQIPIRDLYVFVEAGRVVLWSKRLDKEVLPRLSSAHAALSKGQLPLYRFLYALHLQHHANGLRWDWGRLSASAWLPRVRIGRAVLSLARWLLSPHTVRRLQAAPPDEQALLVAALRAERGIPRFVSVGDNGEELTLDLENELALDVFIDELNSDDGAVVNEVFPAPSSCGLASVQGPHTFEMVVPLRTQPQRATATRGREITRMTYSPGGEWLSFKIYTGPVTGDRILRDVFAPLVTECINAGTIRRWFFLRYADPDFHIRIRFQGDSRVLWSDVLRRIYSRMEPFIVDGSVFQTVVDSYRPELARYGGSVGIEITHNVFTADSRCVLATLNSLPARLSETDRLICAIAGVNGYCDAFTEIGVPALELLQTAIDQRRASVWTDEVAVEAGREQLRIGFRELRSAIDEGMSSPPRGPVAAAMHAMQERDTALRIELTALCEAAHLGRISQTIPELLLSYAHMHVNRILCEYTEESELRIYDSLVRYRESAAARSRAARRQAVSESAAGLGIGR
jgi:thiopeptide-type bacteriocin biosynthesis protein